MALDWKDWLFFLIIFVVSYWIAFVSGASKFIVDTFNNKKKKKTRGTITGEEDEREKSKNYIQKFDVLILFRSESKESTRLAEEFSEFSDLNCELCEADGYDFEVLEHLRIPVVFIIDKSSDLHDFLVKKEKDPKDLRAYKRRYLNNLRYVVVNCGDLAFAQFVDEGLKDLGGRRLTDLQDSKINNDFVKELSISELGNENSSFIGTESPNFHILHTNPHIKVTAEEAARIENENMERLLGEGKLSLVVDLDQTVLHATVDPSVHEWLHDPKHPLHEHTQDIHKVALHDSPHIYYIKLRPGLHHFFLQLSKIFELHVYTMGSRSYAHSVVKLFDPDGRLFNDRILSRDDNEIIENRKKLERIFPTDDRMVLVIDDRTDVWPECKNLIQVPAYNFFVGTGDINSPTGRIDGETGVQEQTKSTLINPNDDVLLTIERVLKNVHCKFFKDFEAVGRDTKKLPNVKEILAQVKSEIFSGFSFVFSGLLHQNSTFEEQEIWKLSSEFGAECEYELSDKTSHLISNRIDTEKALESQERGIPAVKPEWIYECCRKWERLDWNAFKLTITGTKKRLKRSATDLEQDEIAEIPTFEPILDEAELEEIQKELLDLEESEDSDDNDDNEDSEDSELFNSDDDSDSEDISEEQQQDHYYSGAELSDGDFSDLLNYSSSSANEEEL